MKSYVFQAVCLLVIWGASFPCAQAQKEMKPMKIGKVDEEWVKMESYEAEPDAPAVALFDYGQIVIDEFNFKLKLIYSYHRVIKIFSESALEYGDVEIPYYARNGIERVIEVKGYVYNEKPDGSIEKTKFDSKQIMDADLNEAWHEKLFSLPNVSKGSVIEYSYKIVSDDFFDVRAWRFQREIPVAHSQIETRIPQYFTYSSKLQGRLFHVESEKKGFSKRIGDLDFQGDEQLYIAKNLPSAQKERFITSLNDHMMRLKFQLHSIQVPHTPVQEFPSTWGELGEYLWEDEDFGKKMERSRKVDDLVQSVVKPEMSDREKALALTHKLRQDFQWNKKRGILMYSSINSILSKQTGSSGELNILLYMMMKEAGLTAHPALIGTREHGKPLKILPMMQDFNHVLVKVELEEGPLFVDAIGSGYPDDLLPFSSLNGEALVLYEDKIGWESVTPATGRVYSVRANMALDAEGKMSGSYKLMGDGYAAVEIRAQKSAYQGNDDVGFIKENFWEEQDAVAIQSVEFEQGKDINEAYKLNYEISSEDFVTAAGDFLYVQPLLNEAWTDNPFATETRVYPVDFAHPHKEEYSLLLTLPEGYSVQDIPKPAKVILPDGMGSFMYSVQEVGVFLQVSSKFELNRVSFSLEEVDGLKQLWEMIIAKHGEQIVLKKS